jgi:hypothetical protein
MNRGYYPIIALLLFWCTVLLLSGAVGGSGIINIHGLFRGEVSGVTRLDSMQSLFLLLTQIPFLIFIVLAIKKVRREPED